jgi:hypothetical protein
MLDDYTPDGLHGRAMERHRPPKLGPWPRAFGWCSKADVLIAFRAVGQEIRTKCQRLDSESLTLGEACQLARRIKDQRDLIHQISDRRSRKHVRRLMRLNRKQKERLLQLAEQAGLDTSVLIFK